MNGLVEVVLSRGRAARFPPRCVYCGLPEHHHRASASAGSGKGIFFFLSWFESGLKKVEFPACPGCSWRARMRGWIVLAMSALCAGLAGWLLFGFLGLFGGRNGFKLGAVGVFLAGIAPAVIDSMLPAAFRTSFDEDAGTITYRFMLVDLGREFDELNHPPLSTEAIGPEDLNFAEPPPEALVLPADFDPTPPHATPGNGSSVPFPGEYEDRSNPYRNLRDKRFES